MLKRVMAMVLSVCMVAALFTAVSAEETVVGGNQLTKSLTDECADLSKVWSVKNIETADEHGVYPYSSACSLVKRRKSSLPLTNWQFSLWYLSPVLVT